MDQVLLNAIEKLLDKYATHDDWVLSTSILGGVEIVIFLCLIIISTVLFLRMKKLEKYVATLRRTNNTDMHLPRPISGGLQRQDSQNYLPPMKFHKPTPYNHQPQDPYSHNKPDQYAHQRPESSRNNLEPLSPGALNYGRPQTFDAGYRGSNMGQKPSKLSQSFMQRYGNQNASDMQY